MKLTTNNSRHVNMDLLRSSSMFLIVFLHSIDHSGVLENAQYYSKTTYFYVYFTYMLCQVCVNIYVMLSGYFGVNSKFRLQKLVTLWLEVAFYSVTFRLIFMLAGIRTFSLVSLISCLFPFITGRYWYITIYVGLYLISPFLNLLIRSMNRKQHLLLNVCLFGLFSVWSSIHPRIAGMNSGGGWGLAWFVVLYLAAAWFRLYAKPMGKPWLWLLAYVTIPAMLAVILCMQGIGAIPGVIFDIVKHWASYDSAPVYVMTICLFIGFMNIRINNIIWSNVICFVSSHTLGIYLIHAHADVSPWSWEILNLPNRMSLFGFPIIQIAVVIGIYIICVGIDLLRKAIMVRLERSSTINKWCDTITGVVTRKFGV